MIKRTLVTLLIIVLLCLGCFFGYISWHNRQTPSLDDPTLLYASEYWVGDCRKNDREGGCYRNIYLYNTGRIIIESGFTAKDIKEIDPTIKKDSGLIIINKITNEIKNSGILTKDCLSDTIVDVGWEHQINLDGVKKYFNNASSDCKDVFDRLDAMVNDEI